ncbi:MAG: hypothetical protein KAI66_19440 [Lentisphaeria bacterium]|nr:hypothetical protein [Lentisphaeria bacterium]
MKLDGEKTCGVTGVLAVDAGLRMGLAYFGVDGRLTWYRSQHAANRSVLRRVAHTVLGELPEGVVFAIEGGGPPAEVWLAEARRRRIRTMQLPAEQWRADLLLPREQRTGAGAKKVAVRSSSVARDLRDRG